MYILIALMIIWKVCQEKSGGYWNGMNAVVSWIGAITVGISGLLLCQRQSSKRIYMFVHNAGVKSFFIYLWHMPIAGIVARLMDRDFLREFTIMRPFIVLMVVLGIEYLLGRIMAKIKLQNKKFIFGMGC